MKIKYSPILYNANANLEVNPNTEIIVLGENTISVDGEEYTFDPESFDWPDIAGLTNSIITHAVRIDGVLHLTVRRFYKHSTDDWDTGDYHVIEG
jgi:hypothetical protein